MATGTPQPLNPEFGAKPSVYYINIPKTFLAGTVVNKATDECFEGADVTLKDIASGTEMKTKTNNYGDFEFEGLDSGKVYSLKIESAGYSPITKDSHRTQHRHILGRSIPKQIGKLAHTNLFSFLSSFSSRKHQRDRLRFPCVFASGNAANLRSTLVSAETEPCQPFDRCLAAFARRL